MQSYPETERLKFTIHYRESDDKFVARQTGARHIQGVGSSSADALLDLHIAIASSLEELTSEAYTQDELEGVEAFDLPGIVDLPEKK